MVEHADHFHLPPTIQTEPKFGRLPMDAEKKKASSPEEMEKEFIGWLSWVMMVIGAHSKCDVTTSTFIRDSIWHY